MKANTLLLLISLVGMQSVSAQNKKLADSVKVVITLNNAANKHAPVDSAYVIFDRFDRSGAGVVKRLVYPQKNKIILDQIPEGKFFITVICLGIYKDTFSETSFIYEKRKNKNQFEFRLKKTEAYNPNNVYIPAEKIIPPYFSILRSRLGIN